MTIRRRKRGHLLGSRACGWTAVLHFWTRTVNLFVVLANNFLVRFHFERRQQRQRQCLANFEDRSLFRIVAVGEFERQEVTFLLDEQRNDSAQPAEDRNADSVSNAKRNGLIGDCGTSSPLRPRR